MQKSTYVYLKVGPWNLADLVKNPVDDEFALFLNSIESEIRRFEQSREALRPDIEPIEFEGIIHAIESITEKISIASGYAHLRYYADTSSNEASALVTRMEKMSSNFANRALFFDLWFKKGIDDRNADRLISAVPSVYRELLRHKRRLAKYSLSEPEEKVINTLEVTGTRALVKIYDRITSAFEFTAKLKSGGKTVLRRFANKEKLISLIRSPDYNTREAAYKSLLGVYRENSGVLGEIYQNVVIQWRDEAISMRGYSAPISVRNIANKLDDATVDALLAVCRKNTTVFQDYFMEKASMLGLKKLRRYDLYAPLTSRSSGRRRYSYGKAVSSVLDTFGSFDSQFRRMAERVFSEQHVDSEIRRAKRGGAFCFTVTPKRTPYVLLNFDGRT
ncbi:MAG: M3 family metallopeptidase, partial [Nitrososphaera sp.]